ncbi:MAG: hypothetical protein ACKPAH_15705, partial [Verrucomicrobiota bacterium]
MTRLNTHGIGNAPTLPGMSRRAWVTRLWTGAVGLLATRITATDSAARSATPNSPHPERIARQVEGWTVR